jgi:hypothetical protein
MPSALARAETTSMVCGWQVSEMKNTLRPSLSRCDIVMASAAAVASSSMEAFAMSSAVNSAAIVWKFSSASRRPWEISAW